MGVLAFPVCFAHFIANNMPMDANICNILNIINIIDDWIFAAGFRDYQKGRIGFFRTIKMIDSTVAFR